MIINHNCCIKLVPLVIFVAPVHILKQSTKVFEILSATILFGTGPVVNSL